MQDLNKITVPAEYNKVLQQTVDVINQSEEVRTLWKAINVNALDRLKMSDHGPVHFQVVANIGLKIARMLKKSGVELSIVKDHELEHEYGEVVIFLASLMHDLGMTISIKGHEEFSLILTNTLLRELLDFMPVRERTIVVSETLHAIISHRRGGTPYTIEAAIVRVADALDLSKGRVKVAQERGNIDIYSLSAAAIESMEILEGKEKPIQIEIKMNNSVGLFQVDELLKEKLRGSGIEKHFEVHAFIDTEHEKKLLNDFFIKDL